MFLKAENEAAFMCGRRCVSKSKELKMYIWNAKKVFNLTKIRVFLNLSKPV